MSILLQVKNITKIYPNQPKPGLDNISFEVAQGEFLGIMGASGSGKTTLLNVLSTIDVPTSSMKRKEIAEHLFMSERTVSNHLQHIFEKLEVSSAVEAVTKAIQLGYIPPL